MRNIIALFILILLGSCEPLSNEGDVRIQGVDPVYNFINPTYDVLVKFNDNFSEVTYDFFDRKDILFHMTKEKYTSRLNVWLYIDGEDTLRTVVMDVSINKLFQWVEDKDYISTRPIKMIESDDN